MEYSDPTSNRIITGTGFTVRIPSGLTLRTSNVNADILSIPEMPHLVDGVDPDIDITKLARGQRAVYEKDPQRRDPMHWNSAMRDLINKVTAMQSIKGLQCYPEYWMGWMDTSDAMNFMVKYGHETHQGFVKKKDFGVGTGKKRELKGKPRDIWLDEWAESYADSVYPRCS